VLKAEDDNAYEEALKPLGELVPLAGAPAGADIFVQQKHQLVKAICHLVVIGVNRDTLEQ